MSKLTMLINIDFQGIGHERESVCVNLTLHNETPSDEEIADFVRDEVLNHLQEFPAEVVNP
jgi:hypothetical protein